MSQTQSYPLSSASGQLLLTPLSPVTAANKSQMAWSWESQGHGPFPPRNKDIE